MRTSDYLTIETIESLTRSWMDEIRSSVAPRTHLQLRPAKAALLVVDMVRYFAHPEGRCFLPAAAVITHRIASLINVWRSIKRPVIFTRHAHQGPEDLGMLGKFFSDYIQLGKPEAEIVESLAPRAGEAVVRKTTYDAFLNTELEAILRIDDVEQLVITGVLTHMCCETTARSAFCRGYEVYLPIDALASSSKERHLGSLFALADAVGVVMTATEVIDCCAKKMSSS